MIANKLYLYANFLITINLIIAYYFFVIICLRILNRKLIPVLFFQLWYEAFADVPAGTELILEPREPLNLQDMFGDSTSADERSDRETGQYLF